MISSGLFFILVGILVEQNLRPSETQSISGVDYTEVSSNIEQTDELLTSVSGEITGISGSSIVLTLPTQKQIRIQVTDQTIVEKHTQKSAQQMKEQADEVDESGLPVQAFSIQNLSLSEISTNQQVVVDSPESVIGSSNIVASKITIYE